MNIELVFMYTIKDIEYFLAIDIDIGGMKNNIES